MPAAGRFKVKRMSDELSEDEVGRSRSEMQLLGRAIRKGWNIPEPIYDKAPAVMASIVAKGSTRDKIAAMKVLVAMDNASKPRLVGHMHKHEHEAVAIEDETNKELSFDERKDDFHRRLDRVKRLGGNSGGS